jgi:hypothetical protein
MNQHILRNIRQKRRMWKQQQGKLSHEYKETAKKVKNMIRNAKRAMERKLAYEN